MPYYDDLFDVFTFILLPVSSLHGKQSQGVSSLHLNFRTGYVISVAKEYTNGRKLSSTLTRWERIWEGLQEIVGIDDLLPLYP